MELFGVDYIVRLTLLKRNYEAPLSAADGGFSQREQLRPESKLWQRDEVCNTCVKPLQLDTNVDVVIVSRLPEL